MKKIALGIIVSIFTYQYAFADPRSDLHGCVREYAQRLDDKISSADVIANSVKYSCSNYIEFYVDSVDNEAVKKLSRSDKLDVIRKRVFEDAQQIILLNRTRSQVQDEVIKLGMSVDVLISKFGFLPSSANGNENVFYNPNDTLEKRFVTVASLEPFKNRIFNISVKGISASLQVCTDSVVRIVSSYSLQNFVLSKAEAEKEGFEDSLYFSRINNSNDPIQGYATCSNDNGMFIYIVTFGYREIANREFDAAGKRLINQP